MRFKALLVAALVALLAMFAVACGGSDDNGGTEGTTEASADTVEVDVGTDTPIALSTGPLKVDFFIIGTSNQWLQTLIGSAEDTAAEYGWDLEIHDAQFDPNTQLNQIQNTIQRGNSDAALILPVDGNLLCDAATKELPAAGIVPVIVNSPVCGHAVADGPSSWEPGTLTYVGGNNTTPFITAWFDAAAEAFPGQKEVALFLGPDLAGQTLAVEGVLEEWAPEHPEFNIAHQVKTDYTTPTSLQLARDLFQAQPNIDLVMSIYSPDTTRGVVQALNEAGRLGEVPVIDQGNTNFTAEQMKQGNIVLTIPYFPVHMGAESVTAIKTAQDGEPVERFIEEFATGTSEKPPVITPENMDEFTPEF